MTENEINIETAIELSGRSRKTIERAKSAGLISAREVQEGRTRRMLYRRDEILAWSNTARVQPTVEHDATTLTHRDATTLTRRDAATPTTQRHATTRNDIVTAPSNWYEEEGRQLAEKAIAAILAAEATVAAAAKATMMAAAAHSPVLTLAEARTLFRLSEDDLKAGVEAGALKIRRGARGARTVLRAHVEAWAHRLHDDAA
jgi:hypothetical protein